jgi:hypothetical protein
MDQTPELYQKVVSLSSTIDENFLELAKSLRQLQDNDPDEFKRAVSNSRLGARKAYYLVEIDKVFSKIPVPKHRLKAIGWTKLQKLSAHINKSNYADLLKKAEAHTAKDLDTVLRGEQPVANKRAVLTYFSQEDYADLEKAMLKFGGERSGRGIINKEEALLKMARFVLGKLS